jgi:DNA-binding NarL/FixJ family response regulator
LTPREWTVLKLVQEDFSIPQIAERLSISPNTVQRHLRSIFKKLVWGPDDTPPEAAAAALPRPIAMHFTDARSHVQIRRAEIHRQRKPSTLR